MHFYIKKNIYIYTSLTYCTFEFLQINNKFYSKKQFIKLRLKKNIQIPSVQHIHLITDFSLEFPDERSSYIYMGPIGIFRHKPGISDNQPKRAYICDLKKGSLHKKISLYMDMAWKMKERSKTCPGFVEHFLWIRYIVWP